eukprot:gene12845-14074_t
MNFLENLPESILVEQLLSLLSIDDQKEIVHLNKYFLTLVPRIQQLEIKNLSKILKDTSFRENLVKRIHNPYNQLRLNLNLTDLQDLGKQKLIHDLYLLEHPDVEPFSIKRDENLIYMILDILKLDSLNALQISLQEVLHLLEFKILKKVRKLEIWCSDIEEDNDINILSLCQLLSKKNQSGDLQLTELYIHAPLLNGLNFKLLNFLPTIPGLQLLGLTNFKIQDVECYTKFPNLLYLRFYHCDILCNIHPLDSLYGLTFSRCNKISNFQGLNNNHKIVIQNCPNVFQFSNIFQNSIDILIQMDIYNIEIDLNTFHKVQKLRLLQSPTLNQLTSLPRLLPESLMHLEIFGNNSFTGPLPRNKLKTVIISQCSYFATVEGMEKISEIHLHHLPRLQSIEQIGQWNRFIDINTCSLITDFSSLQGCKKIIIKNCTILKPFTLDNVEELTLSLSFVTTFIGLPNQLIYLQASENLFLYLIGNNPMKRGNKKQRLIFPKLEVLEFEGLDGKSFDQSDLSPFPSIQKLIQHRKRLDSSLSVVGFYEVQRKLETSVFLRCNESS